jgi:glycosyltransferase involved in cell wall biosynthesis
LIRASGNLRILYSAIDGWSVPGPHGASVHVMSVAEGLADLGHELHVLVSPGDAPPRPHRRVTWYGIRPPFGLRQLRLARAPEVIRLARRLKPDVVMERYYNFGGEGVLAARAVGATTVLEVNARVADFPGSLKQKLDRAMLIEPLRRWRDWQCARADLVITPSEKIIPPHVPSERMLVTDCGADIEMFRPGATGAVPLTKQPGDTIVIFSGSFRAWHGAAHVVDAIRRLRARGRTDIKAVLIGSGPELANVRSAAAQVEGVSVLDPVPHAKLPPIIAAADIGAAPYDISFNAALADEFHWSPLKVYEYMACGLPVVAPYIERLSKLVRDGREALLYDAADPDGLANAIERLADPVLRRQLGEAARARAEERFNWRGHCRLLDEAIRAAHARRSVSIGG